MVARGEVWWYEHPAAGRRPVLVLTRSEAIPVLTQVIAAPVTTTVRGMPTELELDEDDGMPRSCAVALDALLQVRPPLCTAHVTTLGPERMEQVCQALGASVAC